MKPVFSVAGKSLKDFRKNPLLLVPTLMSFLLWLALWALILVQYGFLASAFGPGSSPAFKILAVLFCFIDVAILVISHSYWSAAYYGIIADVASGKKASFKRMIRSAKAFFLPMLVFNAAKLIIQLVPMVVLLLLASIVIAVFRFQGVNALAVAVLFTFPYAIFLIAFYVMTVFSLPILIERKLSGPLSGFRVIIEAFNYGKKNSGSVVVTVAVIFIFWMITAAFSFFLFGIPDVSGYPGVPSASFSDLFGLLVSMIGSLFVSLFIFNLYSEAKKKSKPK